MRVQPTITLLGALGFRGKFLFPLHAQVFDRIPEPFETSFLRHFRLILVCSDLVSDSLCPVEIGSYLFIGIASHLR